VRLNHVTLGVADNAASVAFHRGLGLEQIVGGDDRYARFVCPDGDSTLSVRRTGAPPQGRPSATVSFECDDLDAKVAEFEAAGYRFLHPPVDQRRLWREARLADPDGHVMCLLHAGENRLDPPWRLRDA
jgi:catechol 2,3-dioxygenase-like lactoylglutathione lyase family enzyme